MNIFTIWWQELGVLQPANLKRFLLGIAKQLGLTFRFLLVDWWWLSLFVLFSHAIMYKSLLAIDSPALMYLIRLIILGLTVYFAFLAASITFSGSKAGSHSFVRQSLFWPIVTPFVLWIYAAPHLFRFFSLLVGYSIVKEVSMYATWGFLFEIDLFASPFFVFFAFVILQTFAVHGVWYALEHAALLLWHTYPLCILMFACLYGLQELLSTGLSFLGLIHQDLIFFFNPIAILIPVGVVLFGAVYRWHMELWQ